MIVKEITNEVPKEKVIEMHSASYRILKFLYIQHGWPYSLTSLSERLKIPKANVMSCLVELEARGFVQHFREGSIIYYVYNVNNEESIKFR
jgi:predicted transcriptional regulator